ncbi:UDP-glycosyltransferase 86a1 [Phtheirospermum japonicum]|uniref:UDP-glycosyltransferase 86a1 n=1 Tax=Phtheirospermum japonicum TaxID=374723 RepID=A0A830BEJ5_9LAMI|nr:UDP-glycosyltransferase 86a1 [Phtheirospermum japonicum]
MSTHGNHEYTIDYIPGVEPISPKDLVAHLQDPDTTTLINKIMFKAFEEVKKADFILHNTVQELEPHTLSTLNQKHPTYAIGPVNFSTNQFTNISKSMLSEIDCTKWLDSKPPGSVLYVSFGSLIQTDKQVIEEIAQGLILSEVNFVWTVRPSQVLNSIDSTHVLPTGFMDSVKDRGLIVPWCNQTDVLSNPAVGGFLTHCGWNSILECIWCGVPMICYPVMFDQPTNRKLVVDNWKIGINLRDGESVSRDEVASKIKKLMSGEISDGIRNEMKKFRSILHNALAEDGSSETNFDRFVQDLKDKRKVVGKEDVA